jgi:hypothetical protein
MNILDYLSIEDYTLSFELLVDGQPISKLVGTSDTVIPYRLFKNGIALSPIKRLSSNIEKRVVAVCSCGEWGCSSTRCDVVKSWDENIIFRDFLTKISSPASEFNGFMFYFSPVNYDSVMTEIFQKIEEHEIIQQRERRKSQT